MTIVTVYDATGANLHAVPSGIPLAGYVTGSGGVPWTAADWAAHPDAVRIDQSPVNTPADETADVLDFENGAATLADVVPWARAAWSNRSKGVRAGQRWPAIYASQSNLTPVANALKAAGITSGVFLWVANWDLSQAQADTAILGAGGPWPVIGVQYANRGLYDVSLFSAAWLANVTADRPAPPPAHPVIPKTQAQSALATLTAYVAQG